MYIYIHKKTISRNVDGATEYRTRRSNGLQRDVGLSTIGAKKKRGPIVGRNETNHRRTRILARKKGSLLGHRNWLELVRDPTLEWDEHSNLSHGQGARKRH